MSWIKKHGKTMIATAVLADVIDEIIIPGILLMSGHPVLSSIAVLGDLDWLTYPVIFFAIKAVSKLTIKATIQEVGA